MIQDWTLMDHYYFANKFWISFNVVLIVPFIISCVVRFFNQDINKHLWTDHLARIFLSISWVFYIYDMAVKYLVDGGDSICEKAFFIHHTSSLFIFAPIILNDYIPWWVGPVGFMHGFCIYFPEA